MTFERVASLSDFWIGEMMGITVAGRRVLLVNIDGTIRAYEDRCPHLGLPLSDGQLDGARLTCLGHQWEYDVCTGRGINPATVALTELPVIVDEDAVLVDTTASL
jgi:toluene monooxygenase system ferredoxin subunit